MIQFVLMRTQLYSVRDTLRHFPLQSNALLVDGDNGIEDDLLLMLGELHRSSPSFGVPSFEVHLSECFAFLRFFGVNQRSDNLRKKAEVGALNFCPSARADSVQVLPHLTDDHPSDARVESELKQANEVKFCSIVRGSYSVVKLLDEPLPCENIHEFGEELPHPRLVIRRELRFFHSRVRQFRFDVQVQRRAKVGVVGQTVSERLNVEVR